MKSLFLACALALLAPAIASAKVSSVYTSVDPKDCKTIRSSEREPNPEGDYYEGHCAGKSGYRVVISGGDIRYDLSLIYKGREIKFTNIGAFHDLGSKKIEWRGPVDSSGRIKFNSLIYRLNISNADGQSSRDVLFVVRLAGKQSCLIGQVEQAPAMNSMARAIADDMSLPCLTAQDE